MNHLFKLALGTITFSAAVLWAQADPGTVLQIETQDLVWYVYDATSFSDFAKAPTLTTATPGNRNFRTWTAITDIVAVNGKPAKGVFTNRSIVISLTPTPANGQAIADVERFVQLQIVAEILQMDGTPVGSLMMLGYFGGPPPPGTPPSAPSDSGANLAVVGGSGAFVGVRGQASQFFTPAAQRSGASVAEDPGFRRQLGGSKTRIVAHIYPMARPTVLQTSSGPGLFHSDFTPVTGSSPARVGETLIAQATGLGPTLPGVDPGQPFPAAPLQQVNSPVEVLINGKPVTVINKFGWPGRVGVYRVDFQVPDGTASGAAPIQLSAAWIEGPPASLPVR